MAKLPERYSKKWIIMLVALFLLTFISLIIVGQILNLNLAFENISGFVLLSLITAVLISLGGYLGARVYFGIAAIFNIIGIIYMLYISLNRTAEGWSDLVSIISLMSAIVIGLILGIVVQVIAYLIKKKKH